jgi:hypothetical protein
MQPSPTPTRPTHIPDFAELCLNALADHKLGDKMQLWEQRQQLTHDDADRVRAKLAITGHLERIEQYRPLSKISNQEERRQAEAVRDWYKEDFLYATVD